jgi:hypothetical protein
MPNGKAPLPRWFFGGGSVKRNKQVRKLGEHVQGQVCFLRIGFGRCKRLHCGLAMASWESTCTVVVTLSVVQTRAWRTEILWLLLFLSLTFRNSDTRIWIISMSDAELTDSAIVWTVCFNSQL